MAGFPHHALDTYLPKLVRAGKRVAICDQLEDPKMTKKLVKRGITELVTPGVSINDNILNYRENNFLAAVHFGKGTCDDTILEMFYTKTFQILRFKMLQKFLPGGSLCKYPVVQFESKELTSEISLEHPPLTTFKKYFFGREVIQ